MSKAHVFGRAVAVFAGVAMELGLLGACTANVEKLWEFPISSPIYSSPLSVDNLIVFGSESGTLYAVDKSGQARWQFQAPSAEIFARPQSDGKLIFFGATNQNFYALDIRGRLQWQFSAEERIKSSPAVADGVVYLTSYDGHVYALKAESGQKIWQFPARPPSPATGKAASLPAAEPLDPPPGEFSYSSPAVQNGVLYAGNMDGHLYAIGALDGKLKWRFKTGAGVTSSPWVQDEWVYVGSKDDHLYALDSTTGNLKWKFKAGDDVFGSPVVKDGVLFVGANDKNFYALDAYTGQEKCHFATKGPIQSVGAFYENLIFFGGGQDDGALYALRRTNCKPFFSFQTGYKIESDPIVERDCIYVTSGDRKLYALKVNKKPN